MVTPQYCQLLARHGGWMNERLLAAAGELSDSERKRDRGAFFGSIHRTLNHIVWADFTWLGRFSGKSYAVPAYGADLCADFVTLAREREAADAALADWTSRVSDAWLASPFQYRAASDGRLRELPGWIVATHLFAHATHHRGQVTTLLKQAGKDPGVTDLPFMPGVVRMAD